MQTAEISRRAVLVSAAASTIAAAPLLPDALSSLWARRARLLPLCTGDDATVDHYGALISKIEEEMIDTPATSAEGLRVKMAMLNEYFSYRYDDSSIDISMLRSMIEDVERLVARS